MATLVNDVTAWQRESASPKKFASANIGNFFDIQAKVNVKKVQNVCFALFSVDGVLFHLIVEIISSLYTLFACLGFRGVLNIPGFSGLLCVSRGSLRVVGRLL